MTERIRQLAQQAGFKVNWQHADVQAIKMKRFEEFARLIVKECIGVAVDNGCGDFVDIEHLLLKHFGVDGMSTEDKKTLIKELLGVKND